MIDWPPPLAKELRRRNVILVLGAGCSANTTSSSGLTMPTWQEFLQRGVARLGSHGTKHIKSAINASDFLLACELLKRSLDDDWEAFIHEQFAATTGTQTKLHELPFKLNQRIVFTTNIDQIYERYVSTETDNNFNTKRYYDSDASFFLRKQDYYLIKLHGCISTPGQIIFSQGEYAAARTKYSHFYETLSAAILSKTLLFIGCGFNDPDMRILLENQRFGFPGQAPHYFISDSKLHRDTIKIYEETRNLRVIKYDPSNNHCELIESLENLIREVDTP